MNVPNACVVDVIEIRKGRHYCHLENPPVYSAERMNKTLNDGLLFFNLKSFYDCSQDEIRENFEVIRHTTECTRETRVIFD